MLEVTRRATLGADFAAFRDRCVLPWEIGTTDALRLVHTEAELKALFDGVQAHIRVIGGVDLFRTCTEAQFIDATTVRNVFTSRWVTRDNQLTQPYRCHGVLVLQDGRWRIRSSTYDLGHAPLLEHALLGGDIRKTQSDAKD